MKNLSHIISTYEGEFDKQFKSIIPSFFMNGVKKFVFQTFAIDLVREAFAISKADKEGALVRFLARLNTCAFIKSTNSVTDEMENLHPSIVDMEAIVKICGEWDREDLKDILFSEVQSRQQEFINEQQ